MSESTSRDGWHYLVMEHLDGLDVGRIATRMGTLDVADACEIVRQAALGLAHIHASGLVHRDIKPSNIMLTRDGNIKLLDLGLVLSGDDPLAIDERLTTVGHLMGTMSYMAPEQLIDSSDVDARADIYALGATLYRLIAGKPPHHRHGGIAKQVMAITNQDPPPIDSVREDLDKQLVKLVTLLASEEDSHSLGQIMRAVEVLTRDTDARTRAANATLRTARLWGGFSSSSPNPSANGLVSTEPSQHYMHHLLEIFPRYGTDGLEAIDTELDQGNVNSRLAAVWLLTNYRSATMPPNFLEHLEKAVLDIKASGGPFANNAARLGKAIAIGLLINQRSALTGQAWLEDHISAEVAIAIAAWKKNPKTGNFDGSGGFGNPSAQWVLDETMLFAAIELEAEGRLDIDWDWLASAILAQRYSRVSDRTDDVFDAVAANASDTLLSGIITELNSMTTPVVQGGFSGSIAPQKSFWRGNQWIPAFKLGSRDSIWPKALAYYADHAENADESIALLEKLREVMIQNGANPNHSDKPLQWIDAAIETLNKR